jgi:hypothetical protein
LERHALVVGSLGDEIVGQVLTVGAHIAETVEGDGDEGVVDPPRSLFVVVVLLFLALMRCCAELLGLFVTIAWAHLVFDGEVDEGALVRRRCQQCKLGC